MKNKSKLVRLFFFFSFLIQGGIMDAQTITFNWNGTVVTLSTYSNYYKGTVQTWTVPPCVDSITVTAIGGAGGNADYTAGLKLGGLAAKVTGTIPVTPGHVLDIIVGAQGGYGSVDGGGGGGGSYVWDNNTTTLLVVAGGGGGAGINESAPNAQTANTSAAALETATPDASNTCGAGGTGGNGGSAGSNTNDGSGCGGAGWLSNGGVVAAGTYYYTGYGIYPMNGTTPGYGGLAYGGYTGAGGFGGGAGGGFNGGGGGGGYNGGGGGKGTGGVRGKAGGGGGSFFNNTIATSTGTGSALTNGTVTFTWTTATIVATIGPFTSPICNGGTTGSATATGSGGASPYTYSWNPGGNTNATATGLSAGTYTVTVTDANGCTGTASVTLTQPPPITTTTSFTGASCNLGNGSATVLPNGGVGPYTYLWNPSGNTNATATGLSANSYTVTVTDNNGCTATASVTITQTTAIAVSISASTNELCNGGSTGNATASVVGGTAPFTYLWTPGNQTNATATGLTAGTYTVVVTDINGCSGTATTTITQPPAVTATITASTGPGCFGGSNGTSTVLGGGGTPNYTYLWVPGNQSNATATGLTAGSYTVTVKDANGCSATASVTITQPAVLTAGITATNNILCNGGTGSSTVTAGGGTPNYSYVWAPNGGSNATGTGLTAGSYTVTVTDANGCTATAGVTITQPTPVTATITATTNVLCNGGTGTATVTAGGGTPNYAYLWSPLGGTNAMGTGLTAGSYTVTVRDANGCTATAGVTITQPTPLTATTTFTQASCNLSNGSATVLPVGGTGPYKYLWTPGNQTNATATRLSASTYTVVVTDNNGCTFTSTVTVTQPSAVTASITASTDVVCNGGNNGTATASAGGGTPNYTYLWTPGNQSNATATGLTAGSYTVTVKDANGCSATASVTITQPPILTATITASNNILCNGGTGSSIVSAGGGTPNYTYLWTPNGGNGATGTGLTAGSYTVTVTDANGCTATAGVTITQPTVLTANITTTVNVSCNAGSNGSSTVSAGGGTPNYTYLWTPVGGSNATGTGLTAGAYTVTVTDANGCTATAGVTITQPPVLTASTSFTQATCNLSNGTATVTAGGGTPNYTYVWMPGNQTNATATSLAAGGYTVVVTDANGCMVSATVNITQPNAVNASITSSTGVSCFGGNNGTATVTATGGTGPYTYLWSPNGGNTATGTGLSAGSYTVTVTDNNGCIITATVSITAPTIVTANITSTTDILCNGGAGSSTVSAGGGTPNYSYLWTPNGGNAATGTGLTAGAYTVTVTDANGCTATAGVSITQPTAVTANITATINVSCFGGGNGSSTVSAGGGTPNYSYFWTPNGGNTATGTGLTAGAYTVTVTDANGCTATAGITITQPAPLTASTSFTQASCNLSNGSATVTVNGGTGPYAYLWTPGNNSNATATGLSANSYTVTVTDNNSCTTTASVTITQPSTVSAGIIGNTGVSCFGGNNGNATVSATGGTGPYTYLWSPNGGNTATGTGLTAGSYTVTVTDNNGCIITATTSITQPNLLTATITSTNNVLCNGGAGSATVTAGGGTLNYSYLWTPNGGNTATGAGLTAGSYTVTVTDANGCTATAGVTITEPLALSATIGATTNVSCNGQADGRTTVTATGGTTPYAYLWAPTSQTTALATGLSAGVYTVTVTDANACTATTTATITEPGTLSTSLTATNILCSGGNSGQIVSATLGGTTPYKYNWSNGETTSNATTLTAGSYTLTVTDANNCTTTASAGISSPTPMIVSATGPQSDCSGAPAAMSVNVMGGTPPYLYNWTPMGGSGTSATVYPVVSTTYTVTVTDANGCIATATVPITVSAALSLSVTGKVSVCPGGTITLVANASGGDGRYNYLWVPSNLTNQTITFNPTTDTVVIAEVTDGCKSAMQSVTVPVTVNPLPLISFSSDIVAGCTPLCIQLNNLSTTASGNIAQVSWSLGDGDSAYTQSPIYCYKDTGTFTLSLTEVTDSGCSSTLSKPGMITVYPLPNARFTYTPQTITSLNTLVQFTDASTDKYPIRQWLWRFEQGSDSIDLQRNPSHNYHDTGTYCATLIVVDNNGCADSVTNCLVVSPLFTFYIPDAFTPNADGINDVFMPKGSYVKSYEMYVFDRWGNELFHTTELSNGWNGTAKGGSVLCQEDTYVYLINVTDAQDNAHSYTGKVNLVK